VNIPTDTKLQQLESGSQIILTNLVSKIHFTGALKWIRGPIGEHGGLHPKA